MRIDVAFALAKHDLRLEEPARVRFESRVAALSHPDSSPMDLIFIRGLALEAIIGIHEHERIQAQRVVIDLEMGTNSRDAAASEDIALTLDYQRISEAVLAFVAASQFLLVETLAEEIASLLMADFSVPWLRLTLHKPDALDICDDVGIVIERGQRLASNAG